MKGNVQRLRFWFLDGGDQLIEKNHEFFPWGVFLTRLLNEKYETPKMRFINLEFKTDLTYKLFPQPKNHAHYCNGLAFYYGSFDLDLFNNLNKKNQIQFVWSKGHDMLLEIASKIKKTNLPEATEYAYQQGLSLDLNPDYKIIEKTISLFGKEFQAYVFLHFSNVMEAKFILERNKIIVIEKKIYQAPLGNAYFLTVFKKIEVKGTQVVVSGKADAQFLPFKVPIDPAMFEELE